MKTIEVKLNDVTYVVGRLNAKDATFITATIFVPILAALEASSAPGQEEAFSKIMSGLSRKQYEDVTDSLFSLIKIKENNILCDVFSHGKFNYENVQDDPYIYLSLLKASFELSFGDFFDSAARVFPFVAAVWERMQAASATLASAMK